MEIKLGDKKILNDSIKSTLFGKFYEKIISSWFREKGYEVEEGKPRIYWNSINLEERKERNDFASKLYATLNKYKKEGKEYCTPDGFMKKDNRYFVWEAKNWALWTEGKKPLDLLSDTLSSMPLILATTAIYRTKKYHIDGFLFSWWSKPDGAESLIEEIKKSIAPRTFEIFYTAKILDDCINNKDKYSWYIDIINDVEEIVDKLFKDLRGESNQS